MSADEKSHLMYPRGTCSLAMRYHLNRWTVPLILVSVLVIFFPALFLSCSVSVASLYHHFQS